LSHYPYRQNTVQQVTSSVLAPVVGYTVSALAKGAQATAVSTGSTITIAPGHGFTVGDKIAVWHSSALAGYSGVNTVATANATSIVMTGGAYSVAVGDLIINFGADTGTSAPNLDGGDVAMYSDATVQTQVYSVTTGTNGDYAYWYYTPLFPIWEIIRTGSTVIGVVQDVVPPLPINVSATRGDNSVTLRAGVDEEIQRWSTTLTGNKTVTLSVVGAWEGAHFRIVRSGLGAFTLNVGGLKTIASATAAFVDVHYSASASGWVLTGYGTL